MRSELIDVKHVLIFSSELQTSYRLIFRNPVYILDMWQCTRITSLATLATSVLTMRTEVFPNQANGASASSPLIFANGPNQPILNLFMLTSSGIVDNPGLGLEVTRLS